MADKIDIELLNNIENITNDVNDGLNDIKLKIYDKAIQIVKNFIIKNNKILYGGIAINALLNKYGHPIYKENDFPDYDFFSVNPINDGVLLANKIYEAGYTYVKLIQAIHQYTVRIQINFNIYICDISYVPLVVYNNLPFVELIDKVPNDKFKYVTPDFVRIQLYKTLCSKVDLYRWKKDYKRLKLINKFYNDENINNGGNDESGNNSENGDNENNSENGESEDNENNSENGESENGESENGESENESESENEKSEDNSENGENEDDENNSEKERKKKYGKKGTTKQINILDLFNKIKNFVKTNDFLLGGKCAIKFFCESQNKTSIFDNIDNIDNISNINNIGNINCLEFLIMNQEIIKLTNQICSYLKIKYSSSKISFTIFSGSTQELFLPLKIIIFINFSPIVILYDYFGFPISFINNTIDNVKMPSHIYFLSMLYSYNFIILGSNKTTDYFGNILEKIYSINNLQNYIKNILNSEQMYYKQNNILGIEKNINGRPNIFKLFNVEYVGHLVNFKSGEYKDYVNNKNKFAQKMFTIQLYTPDIKMISIEPGIISKQKKESNKINEQENKSAKLKINNEQENINKYINKKIPNAFGISLFTKVIETETKVKTKVKTKIKNSKKK